METQNSIIMPRQKRDEREVFKLFDYEKKALKLAAREHKVSKSELIRQAIDQVIAPYLSSDK